MKVERISINWQVRKASLPFFHLKKKRKKEENSREGNGRRERRKERKGMEEGKCSSLKKFNVNSFYFSYWWLSYLVFLREKVGSKKVLEAKDFEELKEC